jgi:uncharacterized lipoprotein NlpE involved in copper resistance
MKRLIITLLFAIQGALMMCAQNTAPVEKYPSDVLKAVNSASVDYSLTAHSMSYKVNGLESQTTRNVKTISFEIRSTAKESYFCIITNGKISTIYMCHKTSNNTGDMWKNHKSYIAALKYKCYSDKIELIDEEGVTTFHSTNAKSTTGMRMEGISSNK